MEKRLQEAQLYKEEGNQRYREGKYRDAVSRYHRALLQLRGLDPSLPSPIPNLGPQGPALTPEQENILHTIQTDCYNNLAACLLQMEPVNYERVREYSQKVLERQPENAKALYRAGVAFFHLQDYDQARHYLLAAVNRQPKDANVRRYLQLTQSELSSEMLDAFRHRAEASEGCDSKDWQKESSAVSSDAFAFPTGIWIHINKIIIH